MLDMWAREKATSPVCFSPYARIHSSGICCRASRHHKRFPFAYSKAVHHLGKEAGHIATVHGVDHAAVQPSPAIGEKRTAGFTCPVVQPLQLVAVPP